MSEIKFVYQVQQIIQYKTLTYVSPVIRRQSKLSEVIMAEKILKPNKYS